MTKLFFDFSRRWNGSHAGSEGATHHFRKPQATDGPGVTALISRCPPLDSNSSYCNLLQCTHFADTCVIAERDGHIEGWLSAYRPPAKPEQGFVWQIAVAKEARGAGLATRMLDELLARPSMAGISTLTTTISEANSASLALFTAFARRNSAELRRRIFFHRDAHFADTHDSEFLISVGPLRNGPTKQEATRWE